MEKTDGFQNMNDSEETKNHYYKFLADFVMKATSADAVVLVVLGGRDGSGSIIAVEHPHFIEQIPEFLQIMIDKLTNSLSKSLLN